MYWLSIFSMIGYLALVGLIFWFATSEVFIVELGSGIWWFALLMLILVCVLSFTIIFHPYEYGFYAKLFNLLLHMALIVVVTYLGLEYQPFENIVVGEKIGALFGFGPGLDFESLPPAKNAFIYDIPGVLDQGRCGSCWAYAAALSLSATLPSPGPEQELACVEGTNVAEWRVSPQALIDLDSYGKCAGSKSEAGLEIASRFALPDAKCVPGYSSTYNPDRGGGCKTSCNSPDTEYCLLNQRVPAQHKFCSDGSPALKSDALVGRQVTRIAQNEASIRRVIQAYGPVVAWVSYGDSNPLWTLTNGSLFGNKTRVGENYVCMPKDDPNYRIEYGFSGHLMTIYGWGTRDDGVRYWLVRNSWGKNWGEYGSQQGSLKIQRGVNAWGIESGCYVLI